MVCILDNKVISLCCIEEKKKKKKKGRLFKAVVKNGESFHFTVPQSDKPSSLLLTIQSQEINIRMKAKTMKYLSFLLQYINISLSNSIMFF